MDKIINTETDSDVKLREDVNNQLLIDSLNNFKIEGKSNKSPSRYKQFQYHLGGYLQPNNTLQTFRCITNGKSEFTYTFEVDEFLNGLDLSAMYQIMSPSNNSVLLSKKLAQLFKVE